MRIVDVVTFDTWICEHFWKIHSPFLALQGWKTNRKLNSVKNKKKSVAFHYDIMLSGRGKTSCTELCCCTWFSCLQRKETKREQYKNICSDTFFFLPFLFSWEFVGWLAFFSVLHMHLCVMQGYSIQICSFLINNVTENDFFHLFLFCCT